MIVFHGTPVERKAKIREIVARLKSRDDKLRLDMIIAPFSYFEIDNAEMRTFLMTIKFYILLVDEAHALKRATGNLYKHLSKIDSRRRLLLTGTPVQVR